MPRSRFPFVLLVIGSTLATLLGDADEPGEADAGHAGEGGGPEGKKDVKDVKGEEDV